VTSRPYVVSVPDPSIATLVGDGVSGVEFVVWDLHGPPPRRDIDLVVLPFSGDDHDLAHVTALDTPWLQCLTLGYEQFSGRLPAGKILCNARGTNESSTAELTMALILASQRAIPAFVRASDDGQWSPRFLASLADRTVLLVGAGGVSRAIYNRLVPFEVTIVRVARSSRTDDLGPILGPASLHGALANADIVVVAVPLTSDTTSLVDEDFLRAMRDGALLVNVSRGKVADTDAMAREAVSGRLRFALDVTEPEPLPRGHPLFGRDNVLITPHVGGATNAVFSRLSSFLAEQIARLRDGHEPVNVVERS
jgi:phosphoglycerate dehydrogenase-like enzyme